MGLMLWINADTEELRKVIPGSFGGSAHDLYFSAACVHITQREEGSGGGRMHFRVRVSCGHCLAFLSVTQQS